MRKVIAASFVLVALFLLYNHLSLGLGVRTGSVRLAERVFQRIEIWFDKTPPTTPQHLSGGAAPTVQRVASYIEPTPLIKHTMAPFDSTGADVLVVGASSHNDVTLTPSDNFNNTWISLAGPTKTSIGLNLWTQLWYARNPKVGPNHIFTVTLSANQALVISMIVVKGSDASDPIDAVSTIGSDAGRETLTPTSPMITTTHSNDLLIGFGKSAAGEVWGAGGGFAFLPGASSDFLVAESGLAMTPGNYNSTFVLSDHTNWEAAIVAVKPPVARSNTSQITLAWKPSWDKVGVVGYQVERCAGADCKDFVQIGMSRDTSFVDSTLQAAGVYQYRVRATDAASNLSEYSNTIRADNGL